MSFSIKTVVLAALAASGAAHMVPKEPPSFPASIHNADGEFDNGPLDVSGSNYPCKMTGPYTRDSTTEYPLGSTQSISFQGSAVHGGGSCQLSITYDLEPTKESVFKVIHSIEGGCPAKNQAGNLPGSDPMAAGSDSYDFQVPDNIPAGEVVFAWTWFNRIGNREMYMTCAPVTLTGDGGDMENFNKLPDIMVANIGDNKCQVAEGNDVKFPNPGESVSQFPFGDFQDLSSNEACSYNWMAGSGPGTQEPVEGGDGGSDSGSGDDAGSADPTPTSAAGGDAGATGTVPGGVFITTPAGGDAAPTESAAPTSTEAAADPVPTADPATGGGSGGSHAEGSACDSEGTFSCSGDGYQQCAAGMWSAVMPMAEGTQCTPGEGSSLNIIATRQKKGKRAMAFRA